MTYCLIRFPQNAGTASGITSGGSYIFTSIASAGILSLIAIADQHSLAIGYLVFALLISGILISLKFIPAGRLLQV